MKVVDRDLADAAIKELSADRRFATAYNAALQLATIVLHASGYRAGKTSHHWVTFKILPEIMGLEFQERANYFNSCRSTRNVTDYDRAGVVADATADEILEEAKAFKMEVIDWLRENHSDLLKGPNLSYF